MCQTVFDAHEKYDVGLYGISRDLAQAKKKYHDKLLRKVMVTVNIFWWTNIVTRGMITMRVLSNEMYALIRTCTMADRGKSS